MAPLPGTPDRSGVTGARELTAAPAARRAILLQPDAADKLQATGDAVRSQGSTVAYRAYFSQYRLGQLGVAFATKLP